MKTLYKITVTDIKTHKIIDIASYEGFEKAFDTYIDYCNLYNQNVLDHQLSFKKVA